MTSAFENRQGERQLHASRYDTARPFAFMHIQKTSGQAVAAGLARHFPLQSLIGGFDQSMFGAFDRFDTLSAVALNSIYFDSLPPGTMFAGHMSYSTLASIAPDVQITTVLREPRSRLLSLWMYCRGRTDDQLEGWGAWRDVVTLSHRSLSEFLSCDKTACLTDNIFVRMLLWPHPLISPGLPIDERYDFLLISEAVERLETMAFYDVIENPAFVSNFSDWLGFPFVYDKINETTWVPVERRLSLRHILTAEAFRLLEKNSRLDRILWDTVVAERIRGTTQTQLADETFRQTIHRHEQIMSLESESEHDDLKEADSRSPIRSRSCA